MAAGAAASRPPMSSALSHPRTGHASSAAPPQQKTPSTDVDMDVHHVRHCRRRRRGHQAAGDGGGRGEGGGEAA
eukprot:6285952-Prymnesium_polylepis.1